MTQKIIKVIKYIIAGGTAAVIDIVLLYVFTDIFGIWYLYSTAIAFTIAFFFSFGLQKFWTFKDRSTDRVHKQACVYFIVSTCNFALNTLFVYLLTDFLHLHYVFGQILALGVLAISSYFIYSVFIFQEHPLKVENKNNS